MRRGRILTTAVGLWVAALLAAGAAFAATPGQIYKDIATHGRLTKNYSTADLQRALHDATLQGYGGVPQSTLRSAVAARSKPTTLQASGARTQKAGVAGAQTLPFTGLQLGGFVIVAAVLLGVGFLLRRTGRKGRQ